MGTFPLPPQKRALSRASSPFRWSTPFSRTKPVGSDSRRRLVLHTIELTRLRSNQASPNIRIRRILELKILATSIPTTEVRLDALSSLVFGCKKQSIFAHHLARRDRFQRHHLTARARLNPCYSHHLPVHHVFP